MAINPTQQSRIRLAILQLRGTSEWRTIKQFLLAAEDMAEMKRLLMEVIGSDIDKEIDGVALQKRREAGKVIEGDPVTFSHPMR